MRNEVTRVFLDSGHVVFSNNAPQSDALFNAATLFYARTKDALVPTIEVTPAGKMPIKITLADGVDEKAKNALRSIFGIGCLEGRSVLPQPIHAALKDHLKDRGYTYEHDKAF